MDGLVIQAHVPGKTNIDSPSGWEEETAQIWCVEDMEPQFSRLRVKAGANYTRVY
jgi:hypothetical protein